MKSTWRNENWEGKRLGLALVDLLFFLGAAVLAAVLVLPPYHHRLLRREAEEVRRELAAVEKAVAQAASSREEGDGDILTFSLYRPFLEGRAGLQRLGRDRFGNAYGEQVVHEKPALPAATYRKLREVVPDAFWDPYQIPEGERE